MSDSQNMAKEVQLVAHLTATSRMVEAWRREKKPGKVHISKSVGALDLNQMAMDCAIGMDVLAGAIKVELIERMTERLETEKEKG